MSNVIAAVDRAAVRCDAATHSELLDDVAPRLGSLANHGLPRVAAAAELRATGDRWARRAAWRGQGSLTMASAAANIVGKSRVRGRRGCRRNDAPLEPDQWCAGQPGLLVSAVLAAAGGLAALGPRDWPWARGGRHRSS
jgi:hypothetical protein